MMFWLVAAVLVAFCLAVVLAPLFRGAGRTERRASYDLQIYRDQLREVERDVERGVVTPEEAEATRTEIARKLLAASDAEAREAAASRAPRRASLIGAGAAGLTALALTAWLYGLQGAPGYPDQPLASRIARAEAEMADAAVLVERLREAVRQHPDEPQGYRFLAQELARLGRLAEAAVAQARYVDLLGAGAQAADHLALAQLEIAAGEGRVSPAAASALEVALEREPENPVARYFWGVKLLQEGKPEEAHALWTELLRQGPADAPWIPVIEAELPGIARQAGLGATDPALPPAASPAESAPDLDRIEGMVASLGERLATEGGPPADWAMLIRSLGVLGRIAEASAIWDEAKLRFAEDEAALALISESAREARLLQ